MSDSAFGEPEERRAACPTCKRDQRVGTLFERVFRWGDVTYGFESILEYYVFQCAGCDTVFFCKAGSNSEDYLDYTDPETGAHERKYPYTILYSPRAPEREIPKWGYFRLIRFDHLLQSLMIDSYRAFNENLNVLAAIGLRTVFDRCSELVGVDTELSFEKKLLALQEAGTISTLEKDALEILIDCGSAAAHRGWKPTRDQLNTLFDVIESFVHRLAIGPSELEKVKGAVPKRRPKPA